MAIVYKKTTKDEINNRDIKKVDSSTDLAIKSTISNFVTYFKQKHLS